MPQTWQDWVLGIGSLCFVFALLPSVLSKHKPHIGTSLLTAVVLTAFTAVYFSLGLFYGAITTGMAAVMWYVLLYQKARR